ncbi:hypothetical protein [Celeribacter sp. ULVN23_4]
MTSYEFVVPAAILLVAYIGWLDVKRMERDLEKNLKKKAEVSKPQSRNI